MGIESDQLVYDYLSRVGDLAQQQQLSSGDRMRLVSTLRGEIDRQRREQSADSPAAVRRIIGRLGTPDELVAAAAMSGDGPAQPQPPQQRPERGAAPGRDVPGPREARRGVLRKAGSAGSAPRAGTSTGTSTGTGTSAERSAGSPAGRGAGGPGPDDRAGQRGAELPGPPDFPEGSGEPGSSGDSEEWEERAAGDSPPPPMPGRVPSPPHMAGTDELGPSGGEPDWWEVEPGPFGAGVDVPGFTGGIEIPAMMRKPSAGDAVPRPRAAADGHEGDEEEPAAEETSESGEPAPRRRRLLGLPRRAPREAEDGGAARRGFSHPLLLFAAVLLVAGAVLGSWLALGAGWLLAYSSRTLSRAEAKWAAMGLPGVVVAGGIVWLWGRMDGRWGEPIARDGLGEAMSGMWPVLVRTAAIASAAFLVWRARRRAG